MNDLGIQMIRPIHRRHAAEENVALAPGKDVYLKSCDCGALPLWKLPNTFLRQEYIQEFNSRFTVPAAQPGSAFVPVGGQDLDRIFSIQHERTVNNDNTVRHANVSLQIEPTLWRSALVGCRVIVPGETRWENCDQSRTT